MVDVGLSVVRRACRTCSVCQEWVIWHCVILHKRRSMEMTAEFIHDRGRGPEIIGTRITVYNLLPDLLHPTTTEGSI